MNNKSGCVMNYKISRPPVPRRFLAPVGKRDQGYRLAMLVRDLREIAERRLGSGRKLADATPKTPENTP